MKLGKIEQLWRYPVKGMQGEQLQQAYAAFSGIMGDRIYGIVAEDGDPGFAWHTARDQAEFLLYKPRFSASNDLSLPPNLNNAESIAPGINPLYADDAAFKVEVEATDGSRMDIEDPTFMATLEAVAERKLRLHYTQKGQQDCRPLSLISMQAVQQIGSELGISLDPLRFRMNFYVDWENQTDPLFEYSLIGKTLQIGERLQIAIIERDPRCKMITLDPKTAKASPKILQHISRKHDGNAGVFAAVLQEGRVTVGDTITLL